MPATNTAETETETASCIVLVSWTAGRATSVEFYGSNLSGATQIAAELTNTHAEDVAHDQVMIARKAAKGVFNHESTPARVYQVKRVNGARAAKLIELAAAADFLSQDEADSDACGRVYAEIRATYFSA